MSEAVSLKVVERTVERLNEEDAKAAELMSNGLLRDMREYGHAAGYRKGLRDAQTILTESLEDVMKE